MLHRFLLLCRPCAHVHPHPFPTRRSSDLPAMHGTNQAQPTAGARPTWPEVSGVLSRATARSEEHTSELQSRGHLVCRLLLEKKKNGWKSMLPKSKDEEIDAGEANRRHTST